MDVSSRVRAQLAEGIWPDEIVARLVAEGLSEANAKRIVDRIAAEQASHPLTPPSQPYVEKSYQTRRFPIEAAVVLLLVVGVGGYGLYQWKRPPTPEEVAAAEKVAAQDAADRERIRKQAEEAEKQVKQLTQAILNGQLPGGQPGAGQPAFTLPPGQEMPPGFAPPGFAPPSAPADSAPTPSAPAGPMVVMPSDAAAQKIAAQLWMTSPDPIMRCEGARYFRDNKAHDNSGTLMRLLENDDQLDVRRCALDALLAVDQAEAVIQPLERMEKSGCCRDLVVYGYKALENHEIQDVQRRAMWGLRRLKVKR